MYKYPQPAPPEEMLRYLGVFQRTFAAVDDYTRRGDRPGMLLGGWLADALHNVPSLLWHYSPRKHHTSESIDAWLKAFPGVVQERGAPEGIVGACERILARGGEAQELGVRDDLQDFDLAPVERLNRYLDMIYYAFLGMRGIRNYGGRPPARWQGLEQTWTAGADDQAAWNGSMASALLPVPSGLVRWGGFDEAASRRTALDAGSSLPISVHGTWRAFLDWHLA